MSSSEPPTGSVPPDPSVPPPPPPPVGSDVPPPPPPPPAPAGQYGAPAGQYGAPAGQYGAPAGQYGAPAGQYGAPSAAVGLPHPGGLLDRFLARLIDFIIVGIVAAIIGAILGAISNSYLLASLITAVIDAVLFLGYFAYLESSRGQTIGKQALKLKTFGPDGSSLPTMEQAVRRNIWTAFGIAGIVPVLGTLLGGLAALVAEIMIAVGINGDPARRQAWHDKFAGGTQVMKIG